MKKLVMLTLLSVACIGSLQALKMRSAEDICEEKGLTGTAYTDCVAKEQKRIEKQKAAIKEEEEQLFYIQPIKYGPETGVVAPYMLEEIEEVEYGPETGVVSPHMLKEAEAVKKGSGGFVPEHMR